MGEQGFFAPILPRNTAAPVAIFSIPSSSAKNSSKATFRDWRHPCTATSVVPYISAFASEEQKSKYLPGCVSGDIITAIAMTEPNTGSDLAAIKTTAMEDGDQIILNGQKTFISNGINCDLDHLAARDPKVSRTIRPLTSTLSRPALPVLKKENRLRKSAGTARIRQNCTLRIAGFRRKTASAIRGPDSSSS